MAIPEDVKDQVVYHTILGDMHRLHATMLNLSSLDVASTAEGLRQHFQTEQNILLGKLAEWRLHRAAIFAQAEGDFRQQVRQRGTVAS